MRALALVEATAATIFAISPVIGQTAAQNARESTVEANSQNQLGGQARDRQIDRSTFDNANNRMQHHRHHHQHRG